MLEEQKNNPLHGVKLEILLTELVEHYGFEILAEQININCFKSNPSIKSSLKFFRKTPWARNKVEAFYLYKFKQLPRPSDSDHELVPRERTISLDQKPGTPAEIEAGDSEFFDDPESGPAFPSKKKVEESRSTSKKKTKLKSTETIKALHEAQSDQDSAPSSSNNASDKKTDPWATWREKNEDSDNL